MAATRTRKRYPAEEARRRILDAAEKTLIESGPESLRLKDLAKTLGISHPAILHHFGSREGVVVAVVQRAMTRVSNSLMKTLQKAPTRGSVAAPILGELFGFFTERGTARLLAWLLLSGRGDQILSNGMMVPVVQMAHNLRVQRFEKDPPDMEDTRYAVFLMALALLGDAMFGGHLRRALDMPDNPEKRKEFQAWLSAVALRPPPETMEVEGEAPRISLAEVEDDTEELGGDEADLAGEG